MQMWKICSKSWAPNCWDMRRFLGFIDTGIRWEAVIWRNPELWISHCRRWRGYDLTSRLWWGTGLHLAARSHVLVFFQCLLGFNLDVRREKKVFNEHRLLAFTVPWIKLNLPIVLGVLRQSLSDLKVGTVWSVQIATGLLSKNNTGIVGGKGL